LRARERRPVGCRWGRRRARRPQRRGGGWLRLVHRGPGARGCRGLRRSRPRGRRVRSLRSPVQRTPRLAGRWAGDVMRFPGDRALTRRLRGFTLLELAVSLLVLGVVIGSAGSLLARTYPTAGGLAGIGTPEAERIEHALLGFLHLRHRLPCPDADGDEIEDCDAASGRPIATGYLPAATLELSLPAPGPGRDAVAYGVHRGAGGDDDLAL